MRINSNHVGISDTEPKQRVASSKNYSTLNLSNEALHLYYGYLNDNPEPVPKLTKTDIRQMLSNGKNLHNPYIEYLIF